MKNLMKTGLLLLIFVFSFSASRAMNTYGTLDVQPGGNGKVWDAKTGKLLPFTVGYNKTLLQWQIDSVDLGKMDSLDFKDQSDIGVILTRLGRLDDALKIFQKLMENHEEEFNIQVNIATVLQLKGQYEQSLQHINRAIEINAAGNNGSEWAHKKMVEAKWEWEKDIQWMKKNTILRLGPDAKKKHIDTSKANPYVDTILQVDFQLRAILPFVQAPDEFISTVFKEIGDLASVHMDAGAAYYYYAMAQAYSPKEKQFAGVLKSTSTAYNKQFVNAKDSTMRRDSLMTMTALYDTAGYKWSDKVYLKDGNLDTTGVRRYSTTIAEKKIEKKSGFRTDLLVLGLLIGGSLILLIVMLIGRKRR